MSARFDSIINSKKAVLVDFYADWCVLCREVPAVLKEVKSLCDHKIRIIKVNVDKYPMIATRFKINKLPTVMLFRDGEILWTGLGVQSVEDIRDVLKKHME